jgi:DNA adenine methylase
MPRKSTARPVLKWAGGKEQLLGQLSEMWPERIGRYVEPFAGGAAVFFHLHDRLDEAHLNDVNPQLVELYLVLRDDPDPLVEELRVLDGPDANTPDVYYRRREEYNRLRGETRSVRRCALFVYLNRTCFNGLYRVNSHGQFNVPFGRYVSPRILDEPRLRRASAALARARTIRSADFEPFLLDTCRAGDLVYLDPPYVPVSDSSYFTSYSRDAFGPDDQRRLAATLAELHERGVRWMLSNSCAPFTKEVFVDGLLARIGLPAEPPHLRTVQARRAINSRTDRRGPVMEYAIRNFDR